MKLTDEKVAKALGYFVTTKGGGVPAIRKRTADNKWDRGSSLRLPAFTTSLDAIVAEIEARGEECKRFCLDHLMNACDGYWAAWEPQYLCTALLAHLKEKKAKN